MIEPKDLLAPTATLFAVTFAVFVFLFIRASQLYKERRAALFEVDVPSDIRKRTGFKIGVLGDVIVALTTSITVLILGLIYCPALLSRIASFYLGSQTFSSTEILSQFRELSQWLMAASILVIVSIFAIFSGGVFISGRLPILARVYIRKVLGERAIKVEADSLLPEARSAYERGAFGEAILYSVVALEVAAQNKLSLPVKTRLRDVIQRMQDAKISDITGKQLEDIVQVRNKAAHPLPERPVTGGDAKQVLSMVEKLLKELGEL